MRTGQLICIILVFSIASEAESKSWLLKIAQKVASKIKGKPPCGATCINNPSVSGAKTGVQETVQETVQKTIVGGAKKTVDIVPDEVLKPSIIKKVNPKDILKADEIIPDKAVPKIVNQGQNVDTVKKTMSLPGIDDIKKIKLSQESGVVDGLQLTKGIVQPSNVKKVIPKTIIKAEEVVPKKIPLIPKTNEDVLKDVGRIQDQATKYNFLRAFYKPKPHLTKSASMSDIDDIKKVKTAPGTSLDTIFASNKANPVKDGILASNSKLHFGNKAQSVPELNLASKSKLSNIGKGNPVEEGYVAPISKLSYSDKILDVNKKIQPDIKVNPNPPKNIVIKDDAYAQASVSKVSDHATKYSMLRGYYLKPKNPAISRVKAQQANLDSKVKVAHPNSKINSKTLNSDAIKSQNTVPKKTVDSNVNQPKQPNIGPETPKLKGGPEQPQGIRGLTYADDVVNKGNHISKKVGSSNTNSNDAQHAVQQADQSVPKYSNNMGGNAPAIDQADYANKKNILLTSGIKIAGASIPAISTGVVSWGTQIKESVLAFFPWIIGFGVSLGSLFLLICCFWIKNECCCCFRKKSEKVKAGKLEITLKGLPAEAKTGDKKKDGTIPVPKSLIKREKNSSQGAQSLNQLAEFYSSYTIDRPKQPKCLTSVKTNEFMI